MTTLKCPKCGGEMEEGFVADFGRNSIEKSQWASDFQNFKLSALKNNHEVNTYRCKVCGYLESYAK